MKSEKLFESLNDIDEKFIQESETWEVSSTKRRICSWKILSPLVAFIILLTVIIPNYINTKIEPPASSDISDLPKLSIDMNSFNGGMGFEGLMAYDIKELKNANPWNQNAKITHLPVFKNPLKYDEKWEPVDIDLKAMEEKAREVAGLLKIPPNELKILREPSQEMINEIEKKFASVGEEVPKDIYKPKEVRGQGKDFEIIVDAKGTITIDLEPAIGLPSKYNFSYRASYNELYKVAKYLKNEYKSLLQMEDARINIYGGDYSFEGDQGFQISFFDSSGDLKEQIINYNFKEVDFNCDDDGKLFLIRMHQPDLSQVVGEYPLIKSTQAKELLSENKYITSIPEGFPGIEYVKKMELIYRGGYAENFIPYYRFYVEMPSMKQENGLKTYGIYYVPAIEEKYIENMPIWDGKFN